MTDLTPQKNHDDIMDLDKRFTKEMSDLDKKASLTDQSQAYIANSVLKIQEANDKFNNDVGTHIKNLHEKANDALMKSVKNEETIANHEVTCEERQRTILDKVDGLRNANESRHSEAMEYRKQRETLELLKMDKVANAAENKRRWTIKTFLSVFFKMGGWFVVIVIAIIEIFG